MKLTLPSATNSFSTRLSLYITLTVGVIFIVAFCIIFWFSRQLIRKEATENAKRALTETVINIEKILNSVEVAVNNMDWIVTKNINNPDSMYSIGYQLLKNNELIVGSAIAFEENYYEVKGRQFSPYAYKDNGIIKTKQLGTDEYDYHGMEWYLMPKKLKQGYWSEPYYDEGGGEMIMSTYSKPLYDTEGNLYAIFTADLSLEWLADVVNATRPYPHSYNLMIGRSGTYIVHHKPERILAETIFSATANMTDTTVNFIGHQMIAGYVGMTTLQNDDALSYVFYAPISKVGWSMAVVCPHMDIFSGADRMAKIVIVVVSVGLLVLLLICFRTISRITSPLRRFAESAVSIAEGNFSTPLPEIKSRDEMWQLQQSFDFMQHSLTDYIEELKTTTTSKERIESELRIASEIQMGMLPKIFPPFPERKDIDLYAMLTPAKEVGGDLYDFFIEDNKLNMIIGDVSGKGIPASLLMAVTRSLFRIVASHLSDPALIVDSLNGSISETNESNMFVTLFVARLDLTTNVLHFCNAGHNPPLLITPDAEVKLLNVESNLPIGLFKDFTFKGQEMILEPGSTLFMYTDGITEAENCEKELYGDAKLMTEIIDNRRSTPREIIDSVITSVQTHVDTAEQSDDLTILCINYKPSEKL